MQGTLNMWLITRHGTTEYTTALWELCDTGSMKNKEHLELGQVGIIKDEEDVEKILDMLLGL